jgi:hydrogenase maturation protein HypF
VGEKGLTQFLAGLKGIDEVEVELLKAQVNRNINTPLTSSCGRLFDAVSSILGIRQKVEMKDRRQLN